MRPALVTIISFSLFSSFAGAQDKPSNSEAREVRRLESVTWDLKSHTLSWTVSKGTEVNGEFVTASGEHYEITPDVATMTVHEEKRGFEREEAALLHRLLDTISIYCAQSVVWWDHGEGTPLNGGADRAIPNDATKPDGPVKEPAVKPSETPRKAPRLGVAEVRPQALRKER